MTDAAADIARRGADFGGDQHDLMVLFRAVAEEDQFAALRRATVEHAAVADDEAQHLGIKIGQGRRVARADLEMADGVAHPASSRISRDDALNWRGGKALARRRRCP